MFGEPSRKAVQKIHFLLLPGFSLFGLTSMLDPLRHANRTQGEALYEWQLISENGGLISSSDSIEIMTHTDLRAVEKCETLIICSGSDPDVVSTPAVLGFIRQQSHFGADIGCQDTGAYIAAAAGILDGYRATMHWENLETTQEAFPKVTLVQELLVIDRKRFSCPGALSGLDMMLYLIKSQYGQALATRVADELVYTHQREHSEPQRRSLQIRLDSRNPNLIDAVNVMEQNIEEPLLITELAECLGISDRELERLFKRHLSQTPKAFYRQLRLEKARWMLQQTNDSVTAVATACGFVSLSHFTRSYQKQFSKLPSRER
ncbi:GlxA family transcriptional regulator [Enterovibrio sp. ZSDZ35]|uniref:GlxA family transcriptional regulator n=1 Tax=Enterovibrio qingdaonensis TaxID=2899818 RepID=A0ABT5QTG6_9GAMM|nr:GlxA family transcriptional regulator [Enterovibrio sp. ZSDZ35]MDD1784265.1 GlxA family transcriptional regulator [Enterovibrio sp. ZSDZ35]